MSGSWAESPALRGHRGPHRRRWWTRAGYTHPLFHPRPAPVATPLPGQGVLLLMGGLVEQSGALDDAIALLELRRARFLTSLRAGAALRVRSSRTAARTTSVARSYVTTGGPRWTPTGGPSPRPRPSCCMNPGEEGVA